MSPYLASSGPSRISIASFRGAHEARERPTGQPPQRRVSGCPAGIRVDAESLAGLRLAPDNDFQPGSVPRAGPRPDAMPRQVREVEPMLWCELEAGHDGQHAARCRRTHDEDSWARWTEPDVLRLDGCPADNGLRRDQLGWACCSLPAHHAGRHSFQYR